MTTRSRCIYISYLLKDRTIYSLKQWLFRTYAFGLEKKVFGGFGSTKVSSVLMNNSYNYSNILCVIRSITTTMQPKHLTEGRRTFFKIYYFLKNNPSTSLLIFFLKSPRLHACVLFTKVVPIDPVAPHVLHIIICMCR